MINKTVTAVILGCLLLAAQSGQGQTNKVFSTTASLSSAQLPAAAISAIDKKAQQKTGLVYKKVFDALSNYYRKKDFSDLDRQTGWYRVDNFLKWIQVYENEIAEDFMKYWDQNPRFAWVYLGARYIAGQYPFEMDFSTLFISTCSDGTCARGGTDPSILIDPKYPENNIPRFLNAGIHEMTHLIPSFALHKPSDDTMFSELLTFYSVHNYALPVKAEQATSFADGVRDFLVTYQRTGDQFELLFREYNPYIIGLTLNLTWQKALDLSKNYQDLRTSLFFTLVPYLFADEQRFMQVELAAKPDAGAFYSRVLPGLHISTETGTAWSKTAEKDIVYMGEFDCKTVKTVLNYTCKEPNSTGHIPLFLKNTDYHTIYAGYVAASSHVLPNYPEEILPQVKELYKNISSSLPEETKQEIFSKTPYLTPLHPGGFTMVSKYMPALTKAVADGLLKSGVRPIPVPEGYI